MANPESDIYEDLKTRLISAEFGEGQRMKAEEFRLLYNCSASTIRENLFRLHCNKFLTFEDQKGFRVPLKSERYLYELANLRILIEHSGVRESIANSSLTWESQITAAHYKLAHIERQMKSLRNLEDHVILWTRAEREFHETLLSGSRSDVLKSTHRDILDRFRQMLVLNYGQNHFGFRSDNIAEHENIVQAALAGHADDCCVAIEIHIKSGISAMRDNFSKHQQQDA
jgi:DNA-binding GntR family transcriptional regulator